MSGKPERNLRKKPLSLSSSSLSTLNNPSEAPPNNPGQGQRQSQSQENENTTDELLQLWSQGSCSEWMVQEVEEVEGEPMDQDQSECQNTQVLREEEEEEEDVDVEDDSSDSDSSSSSASEESSGEEISQETGSQSNFSPNKKNESDQDDDLYGDLDVAVFSSPKKSKSLHRDVLESRLEEALKEIEELKERVTTLSQENLNLLSNFSSLLRTAREDKEKNIFTLRELRNQLRHVTKLNVERSSMTKEQVDTIFAYCNEVESQLQSQISLNVIRDALESAKKKKQTETAKYKRKWSKQLKFENMSVYLSKEQIDFTRLEPVTFPAKEDEDSTTKTVTTTTATASNHPASIIASQQKSNDNNNTSLKSDNCNKDHNSDSKSRINNKKVFDYRARSGPGSSSDFDETHRYENRSPNPRTYEYSSKSKYKPKQIITDINDLDRSGKRSGSESAKNEKTGPLYKSCSNSYKSFSRQDQEGTGNCVEYNRDRGQSKSQNERRKSREYQNSIQNRKPPVEGRHESQRRSSRRPRSRTRSRSRSRSRPPSPSKTRSSCASHSVNKSDTSDKVSSSSTINGFRSARRSEDDKRSKTRTRSRTPPPPRRRGQRNQTRQTTVYRRR